MNEQNDGEANVDVLDVIKRYSDADAMYVAGDQSNYFRLGSIVALCIPSAARSIYVAPLAV
jgi:hypothetical protein